MATTTSLPAATRLQKARSQITTTPGIMQVGLAIVALFALILWSTAHSAIEGARAAVQTIGKDSVPSIIAAQQIRSNLADMDANAANGFFSRGTKAARAAYETDRTHAADMLVSAAQNITYGDEERKPILDLVDGVQTYVGLVETARSQGYPSGMTALRLASDTMHSRLLPDAQQLDQANFNHLDKTYNDAKSGLPSSVDRLWLMGIVAILFLIGIQAFLLIRMKRLINIPLVLATGMLLVWLIAASNTIHSIANDLKTAKQDAFDSIDALWKARAVAYDANGDESLYLLERGSRSGSDVVTKSEQAFHQKSALIADSPLTPDVLAQAQSDTPPSFKGYLGDELRNITFDGEKAAAVQALTTYAQYMAMDAHLRDLETSGRHQEAVDFCTGNDPGQSNWGFAQFDSALGKVIDINQSAFDAAVAHGFQALNWLPVGAVIVPLLVVFLAWLGLLPRLREYSH